DRAAHQRGFPFLPGPVDRDPARLGRKADLAVVALAAGFTPVATLSLIYLSQEEGEHVLAVDPDVGLGPRLAGDVDDGDGGLDDLEEPGLEQELRVHLRRCRLRKLNEPADQEA